VPNFVRATETAVRNETLRRLAIAAIAIERYRLRHGRPPRTLAELVPDYLARVPVDRISGRTFEYRTGDDGVPLLYSLGFDGKDGGGVTSGGASGDDIVWPAADGPPVARSETTTATDPPAALDVLLESLAEEQARDAARTGIEGERVPLIQFEDVPLRELIQTLAREARINLVWDPSLQGLLGLPVSVRFRDVSAAFALRAVLRRHGLRLEPDPKTGIHRVCW
jgi:hypothetical protein